MSRLDAFIEAAPFGMHLYRLEPDGRLVFAGANPAADRILRVRNSTYLGKTIEEAFPALRDTEVPRRYRQVAREGTPWHAEQIRYDHDQIAGAFEVHAFQTAPGEMAAAFQDITDRKRAERALAREKDRLAVTLRSIGDGVIVTDAGGRVTLMNTVAEQLTGWSATEGIGSPLERIFRILSEESGAAQESPVQRALQAGRAVGLQGRAQLVARDGTRRPISDSCAPIDDAEGAPDGAVLVFRDQTAERAQERQLQESEARYRSVVRSVPVVQWTTDRDGRFTLSEGLGLETLGLMSGEVIGRTVEEVYRDNPRILADFRRALGGETFVSENRIGPVIFESRWGPIRDEAGQVVGVAGIAQDVTLQRQLQEQVYRAQKLESVGRLAGGVAHDFNNLLTVILSCAETLAEEVGAASPAARDDVEQIRLASQRARDLTRQLLAFARRDFIAPEPLDLNEVLKRSEKLLRRLLAEDVELRVSPGEALWPVLCDPVQIEQVLLNLAVNASDAMPGGGTLTLATGNVRAASGGPAPGPGRAAGEWVRLTVRDQGVGMSPEVRKHLFEPFFTTKQAGTGLGLATVYGIVTRNGGHIRVDSEPGRGTTFEIDLPRTDRPAAVQPAPPPSSPARGTESVLVIEGDALVGAVTARALEGAGYQVRVARDGPEALRLSDERPDRIDLVVADLGLPGLGVRALVDRLAERFPGLRALYVTGQSKDHAAGRGMPEPDLHLLEKPFTASALLERVRRVLDADG
ncbi:MAG TPA: PAS domain-containing protein [Anaeromyxobacter sp.]|nr:PAS domain-containing protein [Anaeromyxobacter sp.]